jgi:hypothetical protein
VATKVNKPTWRYAEDGPPEINKPILAQDCKQGSAILKRLKSGKYVDAFFNRCGKEVDAGTVFRWMYLEELE